MTREKAKGMGLGVLLTFLPALGGAWAMANVAADRVLGPHIAEASLRVQMMCAWAKASDERDRVQLENQMAICREVGATCKGSPELPANPLLEKCTPIH